MSPEEALIRAIESDPAADLPRLVYADWLDEHGREPFADFLRTELELAKLPLDSPAAPPLRERLWQAWAAVDDVWLHRFTQPRMLRANPTPFAAVWKNFDLGELRPGHGTYDTYPYDSIPPLSVDEFIDNSAYLGDLPPAPAANDRPFVTHHERLDQLTAETEACNLRLPPSFLDFMGDYSRLIAYRSVTDCYYALPTADENPVRLGADGEGTHVFFYADSQYCLLWDLFIHPSGAHCVIARWPDYFDPEPSDPDADDGQPPYTGPRAWFVAPSFDAFVYRVWIENRIWRIQHSDYLRRQGHTLPSMTPAIQAYIDHYHREPGA